MTLSGCGLSGSGALLLLIAESTAAQSPASRLAQVTSLDGAWRMVARSWTVGDSTLYPPTRYSEPGLLLISGGYYSLMYVFTDTPRQLLPVDRDPTDAELARAFNAFYATGGRLERTDSMLTMYVDIAKNPNRVSPPESFTQRWRLKGDTLWLDRTTIDPARSQPIVRRTTYVRAPQNQ
jgi:hypothetical protein